MTKRSPRSSVDTEPPPALTYVEPLLHTEPLLVTRRAARWLAIVPLLALVLGCSAPEPADLLLHNGKIVTVDEAFSIEEAIVVRGDRIVAVGDDSLLDAYDAVTVVDLEGKMLMPGFNDTHIHISGDPPWAIDLTEATSIDDIKRLVADMSGALEEGHWITGYGWSEDQLAERRRPLRWDLDEAAPGNPVILTRAGGHSAVANSLALELAEVTKDTPEPEGGVIEHDENGELNGVIRERQGIVSRLAPRASSDQVRPSFVENLRELLSLGITSIIQAGVSTRGYENWASVYDQYRGELPRTTVQIRWAGRGGMQAFGKITGDGDEWLRVGAVKVLVDGGFTGPAAYTIEPYKRQPDYYGKLNLSEEELISLIDEAHAMGWQMGFHAIGDAAIKLTVDAFVEAITATPRSNHRHYLNHFTVTPPAATMNLMAEHGIHIAQQPNFTYTLEGRYAANLDEERLQHNNPLRTPMDHGVFVAIGSDILPIGPMVGLYAAVTRKGTSGAVYGEDERLTMEEAIRAYTEYGAYLTFEEDLKGTLEPGKLADMVVLSDNLLSIDPQDILDVEVEMVVLGGRIVVDR